jgi:hypothetical protein
MNPLSLFVPFFFLIFACYLATLSDALKKCAPDSRTMNPGKVWLTLIPIFGQIWQFVVVMNVTKSLEAEYARREIPRPEGHMGRNIGLAKCICECYIFIPKIDHFVALVVSVLALASLMLWIIYWIRVAGYSRVLDAKQSERSIIDHEQSAIQ